MKANALLQQRGPLVRGVRPLPRPHIIHGSPAMLNARRMTVRVREVRFNANGLATGGLRGFD